MKETKQTKKKQAQTTKSGQPKKSLLTQYLSSQPSLIKTLKSIVFPVLLLIMCMITCFIITLYFIGNGAYGYSENTYGFIKETTHAAVTEDITDDNGEILKGGVDIAMLRENKIHYDISDDDAKTKVVVSQKNGFFEAVETYYLSDSFTFTRDEPIRNFDSLQQYMNYFWRTVIFCTFGIGTVIWLLLLCLYHGIIALTLFVLKKKSASTEKTEQNLENNVPNQQEVSQISKANLNKPLSEGTVSSVEGKSLA